MSLYAIGFIGLAVVFILMFLRVPIAISFAAVGFFGAWAILGFKPALAAIGIIPYTTMTRYIFTVIPLFVWMGYLALYGGIAEEFYEGIRRWIGHFRGGLAAAVVLGNTGFGACTGDPVGAAVTFTAISLPQMRKYGYADTLTLGSIAGGAILALLIPPSAGFILYGAITETSIGELFIAGIFPGLILAGFYIGVIYFLCRRNPALGPPSPKTTWGEKMGAAPGMWALIVVFVVIIGGLYVGLFTPTEAGAFGAFIVLVLGLARRRLSWQGFKTSLVDAGVTTGMVAFLLVGVMVFNLFLATTKLPFAVATILMGFTQSPIGVLLIIVAILFALGMVVDIVAMILLMVPIFYPIVTAVGIDPIHFGVVIIIMMAAGSVSPPYGMVVYAMSGMVKDVPLFRIFRGVIPFLIAMVACEMLVVFIPQIAVFLPSTMMGG